MKKTIQINIAGFVFNIEEDAFQILQDYLSSIQKYFSTYEDSNEIVVDIEARIAEKFIGKNKPDSLPVITQTEVQQVIASMGSVADFEAVEENILPLETSTTATADKEEPIVRTGAEKRLCRDAKRKVLGGVLAGLANYFNTDSVWVRVAYMVCTLGFMPIFNSPFSGLVLIVAYLILWIVLPTSTSLKEDITVRKFYRDADNKVIGGVAAGLAKYFKVDISILRIIFIVSILFFGFGLLGYLILWMVSPLAQTVTQKMEMKGEAMTIENIDLNIKQNLRPESKTESTLAAVLLFPFRIIGEIFRVLGRALASLGPVLRILFGILVFSLGLVLMATAFLFTAVYFGAFSDNQLFVDNNFFTNFISDFPQTAGIFLFLTVAIPATAILLSGIILLSNKRRGSSGFWRILLFLWLAGILGLAFFGGRYAMNFVQQASIQEQRTLLHKGQTLYLEMYDKLEDQPNPIDIDVTIEKALGSHFELQKTVYASGSSNKDAQANAAQLSYQIIEKDSALFFDEYPTLTEHAAYRNRSVQITLKIPEGKKVHFSRSFTRDLLAEEWVLAEKYGLEEDDFDKFYFTMKEDGTLSCDECEPLDEQEQQARRERSDMAAENFEAVGNYNRSFNLENYHAIEVGDNFNVLLKQAEKYEVRFNTENEDDLDNLSVNVQDGKLKLGFKDRFKENHGRINVFVTLPKLGALDVTGNAKLRAVSFKELDKLALATSGAANVQLDVEVDNLDVEASGACKIEVRGLVERLDASLSGASELIAKQTKIAKASISASGTSHVALGKVPSLESNTSGASNVEQE